MEGCDYDFSLTVKVIANSSQVTAHKLTGRTKGEMLSRSTRSKVIYEIIKLMGTSSAAILQEVVFDKILDTSHEFFATLAPKAQLGGNTLRAATPAPPSLALPSAARGRPKNDWYVPI